MTWKYRLVDGELAIEDESTGSLAWRGKPDGHSVSKLIPIDDECVILLDYKSGPNRFENLIKCRADGSIVWKAKLPAATGSDVFTSVKLIERGLKAFTWSGFEVIVDTKTGNLISTQFVK